MCIHVKFILAELVGCLPTEVEIINANKGGCSYSGGNFPPGAQTDCFQV